MTSATTTAPAATAVRPTAPPRATLMASMLGFFMISIDVSAVNVGLVTIGRQLHGGTSGLQWVVDGYTLMFAALLLSAGAFADRAGAGRAYRAGLMAFTLASVACGLAPSLAVLVAARVVQGSAAAVMLPSSLALLRLSFPEPTARSHAVAAWTAAGAAAVAAGPVLGGVLITTWSWRGVFLINVPAGLAALALVARVPASCRRSTGLDVTGQLLAVLATGALTYALIGGGQQGYRSPVTVAALAVAGGSVACFVLTEARAAAPVLPLSMLRNRTVVMVTAAGFAANAAFYGLIFVAGLYAQQIRGWSPLGTGLLFVPIALSVTSANLLSPALAARLGVRACLSVGPALMAVGAAGAFLAGSASRPAVLAGWIVLLGFGGGVAVPTLTTVLLGGVPAADAGLAGGLFNAARQVGSALSVALFGSLVAGRESFPAGMRASFLISAVLMAVTAAAVAGAHRDPARAAERSGRSRPG